MRTQSSKSKVLILLVVLVVVGAVTYFGFFKSQGTTPTNPNATPASKLPAKEHILGLDNAAADLKSFMTAEYDRQNNDCKQKNSSAELAMGVYQIVRNDFVVASLGCGESGTSGYYAKINGTWKLAFKADDLPECKDVNASKFTKEIVPDCVNGNELAQNQNP
jgi:hypothetical protein